MSFLPWSPEINVSATYMLSYVGCVYAICILKGTFGS